MLLTRVRNVTAVMAFLAVTVAIFAVIVRLQFVRQALFRNVPPEFYKDRLLKIAADEVQLQTGIPTELVSKPITGEVQSATAAFDRSRMLASVGYDEAKIPTLALYEQEGTTVQLPAAAGAACGTGRLPQMGVRLPPRLVDKQHLPLLNLSVNSDLDQQDRAELALYWFLFESMIARLRIPSAGPVLRATDVIGSLDSAAAQEKASVVDFVGSVWPYSAASLAATGTTLCVLYFFGLRRRCLQLPLARHLTAISGHVPDLPGFFAFLQVRNVSSLLLGYAATLEEFRVAIRIERLTNSVKPPRSKIEPPPLVPAPVSPDERLAALRLGYLNEIAETGIRPDPEAAYWYSQSELPSTSRKDARALAALAITLQRRAKRNPTGSSSKQESEKARTATA